MHFVVETSLLAIEREGLTPCKLKRPGAENGIHWRSLFSPFLLNATLRLTSTTFLKRELHTTKIVVLLKRNSGTRSEPGFIMETRFAAGNFTNAY